MLEYKISNLELCWLAGFRSFHRDVDVSANPFRLGTKEAHYWQEGWWEGFYNTDNLSDTYRQSAVSEEPLELEMAS